MGRKLVQGLVIGLAAAAIVLYADRQGWLTWLENRAWDWRVRAMAQPSPRTDDIRLILIDQASLDWSDSEQGWSWPWPRESYEPILAFCRRAGARAVVFDMLYTEPSVYGVEDDERFGAAIRSGPPFVGVLWLSHKDGDTETWPPGVADRLRIAATAQPIDAYAWQNSLAMRYASPPVSQVATSAWALGTVYATADPDALIRHIAPFHAFAGRLVPSLGLAAWMADHPDSALVPSARSFRVGNATVPLNEEGNAILRYRGPSQTHKAVGIAAVFQSEMRLREGGTATVDPAFFAGKYVFLGPTAPGLKDLKPTPISRSYPGVEIHATFLDNLLNGDFVRLPGPSTVLWMTVALAVLSSLTVRFSVTGWQTALALVVFLAIPVTAGFIAYARSCWLSVAVPGTGVVLSMLSTIILNYATEGRQKRFIKNAFQQYLSSAVIDKLIRDPARLKLGGELRELSIYFSDVQGFTTISEALSPENLTALLNEYLTAMSDIIMEQGGTIDKYEGDAIIAFWNAPMDLPDHPVRAVRSALLCQAKLAEMRPLLRERAGRDLFCRIGLNTGKVVVGNMGSHQRFNYTFLGDAGNLAARLEGVNKQFGTYIMVSEFTRQRIPGDEFHFRELSRVQVVGRKEPVRVYEPMLSETARARADALQAFERGLQLYYAGQFKDALGVFEPLAAADPVAGAYIRRCRFLLDHAPSGMWQGVWEMTEK